MEDIKVPESVQRQLSAGEKVIGKYSGNKVDYFATDKRLLVFRSASEYRVLEYNRMSMTFKKYGGAWHLLRAFLLLVVVYALTADVIVFNEVPIGVSILVWIVSLCCIFMAVYFRYAYYQIESPDIDSKKLKEYRILRNRWGSGNAKMFAEVVQ